MIAPIGVRAVGAEGGLKMDRIIDILGRRNGRDSFIFLLTCVIGSYDRLIGKNIFISYVGLC